MAFWQPYPDSDSVKNSFDIFRTPPKGKFEGIFTSEIVLGTPVHYFGGRTIPHDPENGCYPCQFGRSYRWMAYFGCINVATDRHVIFEVTAKIHNEITTHEAKNGGLRGCRFRSLRPSGRLNGRIQFLFSRKPREDSSLPAPPDVPKIMDNVWQRSLDALVPENRSGELQSPADGSCTVEGPRPK